MLKRMLILGLTTTLVGCASSPYMDTHAYRDKKKDYHHSQVTPSLKEMKSSNAAKYTAYPLPPENLRGDTAGAPDLWPPDFPQPKK